MWKNSQKKNISKITLNHPVYKISPQKKAIQSGYKNKRKHTQNIINLKNKINQNQEQFNEKQKSLSYYWNNVKLMDFINSYYFGEQSQNMPKGQGIFIDDEFNIFVCTNWNSININSMCFIKLNTQAFIYGIWKQGKLFGQNAITKHFQTLLFDADAIYYSPLSTNQFNFRYFFVNKEEKTSQLCLIDAQLKLVYIIEIILQKNCATKLQIVNRINVQQKYKPKNDRYDNRQSQTKVIDPSQQLGYEIPKYLLSQMAFLNYMCKHTKYIKPLDLKSGKFMLSLFESGQNQGINFGNNIFKNDQKLGITIDIESMKTCSIGKYNNKNQLNGMGICNAKDGSMLGIFKQDMLISEFNFQQNYYKTPKIVTPQIKQVISREHMKSLNYSHNIVYFEEVCQIKKLFDKIITYTKTFEVQYRKKYPSEFNSQNNIFLNSKYSNKLQNQNNYKYQRYQPKQELLLQKRPGFILSKSRIRQNQLSQNKSANKKNQYSKQQLKYRDKNIKIIQIQSQGSDIIYSQYLPNKKFQAQTSKEKGNKFNFNIKQETIKTNEKSIINTVRK